MTNLIRPTRIDGKNATLALTGSAQAIVSNPASRGRTVRVVSLYVANVDGVNDASVTVDIYDGTTARYLAKTIAVPADSTLTVITSEDAVYLNEGESLRLSASATNDLEAIVSYEEIS
jgi:hypothetical protein